MNDTNDNDRRIIGARIRTEVLGISHVRQIDEPTIFDALFREFTEEFCWGNVWAREGLPRHTRSMLNIAMLSALGRWNEFEVHVRGALNNGVTEAEIAEVVLQAGVYAGVPVAAEGMRRAKAAVRAHNKEAHA